MAVEPLPSIITMFYGVWTCLLYSFLYKSNFCASEKYNLQTRIESGQNKWKTEPYDLFYMSNPLESINKNDLNYKITREENNSFYLHHQERCSVKNVPISEILWNVYNVGKQCAETVEIKSRPRKSVWNDIYYDVKDKIGSGSLVELGMGIISLQLADLYANKSVFTALTNKFLIPHFHNSTRLHRDNVYVGNLFGNNLAIFINRLKDDHQVLFGNLILSDLPSLVAELLPHEFEELLTKLLSLSMKTLIVNLVNAEQSMLDYFELNWPSAELLIQKACAIGKLICKIEVVGEIPPQFMLKPKWDASSFRSVHIVTVSSGARQLPQSLCQILHTSTAECQMEFSEDQNEVYMKFSDLTTMHAPVIFNSIPLSAIFATDVELYTKEKLFLEILEKHYSTNISLRSLFIDGSRVRYFPNSENTAPVDVFNEAYFIHRQVNQILNIHTREEREDINLSDNPDPNTSLEIKQFPPDIEQVAEEIKQVPKPVIASTVDSQVDGVAQQWHRVEGVAPTGIQADKQHIQSMKNQWDRVELNVKDNEIQRSQQVIHLDEVWDRETRVGDKDHKTLQQFGINDFVLSKDENDLKKAMRYLNIREKNYKENNRRQEFINKAKTNDFDDLRLKFGQKSAKDVEERTIRKQISKMQNKRTKNKKELNNDDKDALAKIFDINHNLVPNHGNLDKQHRLRINKQNLEKHSQSMRKLLAESVLSDTKADSSVVNKVSDERLFKLLSEIQRKRQNDLKSQTTEIKSLDKTSHSVQNVKVPPNSVSASNRNKRMKTKRTMYNFQGITREEEIYDLQWKVISGDLKNTLRDATETFTLLTYGGHRTGLLGLKVAKSYPLSSVVSVTPPHKHKYTNHLRKVCESLAMGNIIQLETELNTLVIDNLYQSSHITRFQFLSVDIFKHLLNLGTLWLLNLGKLLTLSRVTWLEIPSPEQLITAQILMTRKNDNLRSPVFKGMIYEALSLVGADAVITVLDDSHLPPITPLKIMKVQLQTMQKQILTDCSESKGLLTLQPGSPISILHLHEGKEKILFQATKAFSLHSLLILGLAQTRLEIRKLFFKLINQPLYSDMCPHFIHWSNKTFSHNNHKTTVSSGQLNQSMVLLELLTKELKDTSFSFLSYNAKDTASMFKLAGRYNRSTFVQLVHNNKNVATSQFREAKSMNLSNLAVASLNIDAGFGKKLMNCPDFLRYQFIDMDESTRLFSESNTRSDAALILGQLVATSVTTFIQVPSDKALSVTMNTLFHFKPFSDVHRSQIHKLNQHPLPEYMDAELQMIKEMTRADVNINVSAEVITPPSLPDGGQLPWKLLRIDVRNLTVKVDHHFDYERDGSAHKRKYILQCTSNKTNYSVKLIREQDGYVIPYGNVNAISLIALLRMGIVDDIKQDLYNQFLHLPLYEDMAPWNIGYRHGKLEYIDYDSKDHTLTHMSTAAFQIMFMLMNYERTVADFGKCKRNAKVMYGMDLVGKCVGSDFEGPCKDSSRPVPCGDHTCRATYIECLQVLNALEQKMNNFYLADEEEIPKIASRVRKTESNRYWTFNNQGR